MSEIERYNGLTTADKGALLDAKARGYEFATININGFPTGLNIDLALAQIAEMETAQTPTIAPLTWNERINQMTVEEKAKWLYDLDVCRVSSISIDECNSYRHCTECMRNMLNSLYTEGAANSAAEVEK